MNQNRAYLLYSNTKTNAQTRHSNAAVQRYLARLLSGRNIGQCTLTRLWSDACSLKTQKGRTLSKNVSLEPFTIKIGPAVRAVGLFKKQKKTEEGF
jgi:hypothetical protein